jgi:predicted O-methyltransferase YrrM
MEFEEVRTHVAGIPYINPRNAAKIYDFIVQNENIRNVLELGFAHGTGSCYIAAALDEVGGKLVSVDLVDAKDLFRPSIEDLLEKTGLRNNVEIFREKTGYNWFLHNEIKANTVENVCVPKYDLCIIDGPKNWTIDGAAFFMVDKLLRKDGWIIFDDYTWSYANAAKDGSESTDGIAHRSLSEEELNTPQIKDVFQLLVMQHPNYGNFRIHGEGDWAWAQKTGDPGLKKAVIEYNATYKDGFSRLFALVNKVLRIRET